jgi:hypothetical protein
VGRGEEGGEIWDVWEASRERAGQETAGPTA